ncbi:NAD-dependent deacylase [Nitrogeniibacter mangrovi]|uniref:NAD-dependent protein deacylase n=1 Tax=Nitrogeniibacter mangrovi TaxID=2016596 RepID=A0A6C1B8A5_9RHOO|nr:NAD-dependent deacylase [Nitrogeniibacter mangrovi]QID19613.1 NAD-dependent deacylase [Nitrogeniibacter mangrovi]
MTADLLLPDRLLTALREARHVTVFTGAGVSAESGVPTFRDAHTGLWARFDPAALATPEAFAADPALVWGWYEWRRARVMRAAPNPAHRAIAALARHVPALSVITQNVDDLHERAGSTGVAHLHGRLMQPRCSVCGQPWRYPPGMPDEPAAGRRVTPPDCPRCAGPIRPGVVWFGEPLPADEWQRAMAATAGCDLFITVGTSALVYPAAQLPQVAAEQGARVLQLNPQPTALDTIADWNLLGPAGTLLPALVHAAFGEAFPDTA